MISGIWGVAEIQFWTDRDTWPNLGFELTSNGNLFFAGNFQWKSDRPWNIKIIENFINFLTRGRTQCFNSEQRSYDQLKSIELTRYDL
jgi:hypothetical protein